MPTEYDSRSEIEKIIDVYVNDLQIATGKKNPNRRKGFEDDVNYALQVTEPFKDRYASAKKHDIFAIDDNYDKAMEKLNNAIDALEKFGVEVRMPSVIENPHLIEAECIMALTDTLRSLNAFEADAGEKFIAEVIIQFFGKKSTKNGLGRGIGRFLNLYVHDAISDHVLDKMTFEESYLEAYLKSIQKES